VGDFNIPLHQWIGHPDKNQQRKKSELDNTIDQIDWIDIYRIYHPKTTQYIFFSAAHGNFSKIDILEH
jgi:exonuclease III